MIDPADIHRDIELGVLVHPKSKWHDFYTFLKSRVEKGIKLPLPLILGGSGANDFTKTKRLKDQLDVAQQSGELDAALKFLTNIPVDDWVKSDGNLDPNAPTYY